MTLYFAPVQGHTDAAYRHYHALHYGLDITAMATSAADANADGVIYTTPFIRLEKGEIRKKDLKDITSELNDGIEVVPQVIFKNEEELKRLIEIMRENGNMRVDINMGCPFPLQTSRGRGAATVGNDLCREAVAKIVKQNDDMKFSVKMRLGYDKEEYAPLMETLNTLNLDHISVHPRTAKDQYTGALHTQAFDDIYHKSTNPLVFNGDITTPEQAYELMAKYPDLHGIMIGRGALARPSIFTEILKGEVWDENRRRQEVLVFHKELLYYYRENLVGGEHQILSKILPFWEYSEDEIGRKAWKAIKKASNISKYQTALALI